MERLHGMEKQLACGVLGIGSEIAVRIPVGFVTFTYGGKGMNLYLTPSYGVISRIALVGNQSTGNLLREILSLDSEET